MDNKSNCAFNGEYANDSSFLGDLLSPKSAGQVLFNTCTKFYPDGEGGWVPVKRVTFDRLVYNPRKAERLGTDTFPLDDQTLDDPKNTNFRSQGTFWKKSFNRARQAVFDLMMCNPDVDTFLTFTVDPKHFDSFSYSEVVSFLSTWLDNRVRRHDLKYILVPEHHVSGAIHFHGMANWNGLKLEKSGYFKVGKYTLLLDDISSRRRAGAQEIFNVRDLGLGFSTAIRISGDDCQVKVSKYIWKYMTKQGGQRIGGRFYLHGGKFVLPKLVYSNELFSDVQGTEITYGGTTCKVETLNG